MYIGGTGAAGLHHLVWEIFDNSVDEAMNGHADEITVTLHKDGSSVTVSDNGRGIPVDPHPTHKKPALEIILCTLHAGGKFDNGGQGNYKTSGGLHGVGASVVKAHAIETRTQRRVDHAIDANYRRQVEAQRLVALTFASAGLAGGLASAGVVVVGLWLGVAGELSLGTVIAFAFLVSMVVGPVQMATQVLTEAQNAVASWRRVIGVLDTPADVVDPGESGTTLPDGALEAHVEGVSYAYPDGPTVLTSGAAEARTLPGAAPGC